MDDMVFQYNNQNSIYVLNSDYNSYEQNYPHLNIIESVEQRLTNNSTTTTGGGGIGFSKRNNTKLNSESISTTAAAAATRRLQQRKLKNFEEIEGGHFDGMLPDAIGNPITSLMSSATCSPAAAAIHKLFNCNSNYNNNNSINGNINSSITSYNSNNTFNYNNNKSKSKERRNENYAAIEAAAAVSIKTSSSSCSTKNITNSNTNFSLSRNNSQSTGNNNNSKFSAVISTNCNNGNTNSSSSSIIIGSGKKKCNSVKSTLIAKKTKFWKFLEEEKTRAQEVDISNGNLKTIRRDCEECASAKSSTCCLTASKGNFCAKDSRTFSQMSESQKTNPHTHEMLSSNSSTSTSVATKTNEPQQQQQQQQFKVNNWSGSPDSSNNQLQQQQQQQLQHQQHQQQHHHQQQQYQKQQQQQKSSYELYQEAAELLGLSCTLCDNCRCLDCQSGYFDCDDSDSYSEFSTMDDYDYDEQLNSTVTAHEMALIMHASSTSAIGTDTSAATTTMGYRNATILNTQTANFACCGEPAATSITTNISNHLSHAEYIENFENYAAAVVTGASDVGEAAAAIASCYSENFHCGMEPHTNDLDESDDKSGGNNDVEERGFYLEQSTYPAASKAMVHVDVDENDEATEITTTTTTTTTNSMTLENTRKNEGGNDGRAIDVGSDCGALITALNSKSWEESKAKNQQHRRKHQHQHQHQPKSEPCNEVENCASFNGLSLLDAKTVEVDSTTAIEATVATVATTSCEQK